MAWRDERSSLVVMVPEAEEHVARLRRRFDQSCIDGLGAHITLLYPFRLPNDIGRQTLSALQDIFHAQPSFEFSLAGVCGFPGVVYLNPLPVEPFRALTRALANRFPGTPPYGGAIPDPMPHLTVAHSPLAMDLRGVTEELMPLAEIQCRASEASLCFRGNSGWKPMERFGLGHY